MSIEEAISKLYVETEELMDAFNALSIDGGATMQDVRREAADIANFAHMIIYNIDDGKEELVDLSE